MNHPTPGIRQTATPRKSPNSKPLAHRFWDVDGEFKPLHQLNPVRARLRRRALRARGRARARRGLRRRAARRSAGARGRAGHGHRSRAEHGGNRPPACARSGLTIDYRVEDAEQLLQSRRQVRRGHAAWKCSSTCPIRPRTVAVLGKLVRPGGHVFVSTHQPQSQVVRAGHRRRRIRRASWCRAARMNTNACSSPRKSRASRAPPGSMSWTSPACNTTRCASSARSTRDPSVNYLMHLTRRRAQGAA